ncbi:hypothetical protein M0R72_05875 [Candidatus Pacearchaeota archaeon]|jgi:hypothetical protein|nr:hypothetical protein [Candidatus Pacearchaeota archaeon]
MKRVAPLALLLLIIGAAQGNMVITETTAHLGNHLYTVAEPVCEVYTTWLPGMVPLYHVVAPFNENYDNVLTTDAGALRTLLDTGCWRNATEQVGWIYAVHMTNTRALHAFHKKVQLVSGEVCGGDGIGDHMYTTKPDAVPDGYVYDGVIGFVPDRR